MGLELAFAHRRYTRDGGVERNMVTLAEGMAARGHQVTLLCERVDVEPPAGANVVKIKTSGPSSHRLRAFDRGVREAYESGRFDVVQGFDLTTRQDVIRVGRGLVSVYRERLDKDRGALDRLAKRLSLKQRTMRQLEAEMLAPEAARRIVANSNVLKREIIEAYGVDPARIDVIHNGVAIERFTLGPPDAALLSELGVPTDAPRILFIGTGYHRKGLATLIDAMRRVVAEFPSVRLIVVGRDGRPDRYRRLAEEAGVGGAITWAGSQKDVERFFTVADAVALPSRYDPFGNVGLESIAAGVPAVVSECTGSSELFEGALRELVLPDAEDAEGLADRLLIVLRDAAAGGSLRTLARQVGEKNDLGTMLDKYEHLYESLARERTSARART